MEDEINSFLELESYYSRDNGMVGHPLPLEKFHSSPRVRYLKSFSSEECEYSIITPVYNQRKIPRRNIENYLQNTSSSFEIIVIMDACDDGSVGEILSFFESFSPPENLTRVVIIENEFPLFETCCDNIGFRLGNGKYFIEIQIDINILEKGYNLKMKECFSLFPDLIGVSGRGGHSFYSEKENCIGKLGDDMFRPLSDKIKRDTLYICESVIRGPLMLDASKIREMGYLDEANFFLGNDDHDLFARAYSQKKWRCGYLPIEFESPSEDGSTRKKRNELNQTIFKLRKARGGGGWLAYFKTIYEPRGVLSYKIF